MGREILTSLVEKIVNAENEDNLPEDSHDLAKTQTKYFEMSRIERFLLLDFISSIDGFGELEAACRVGIADMGKHTI